MLFNTWSSTIGFSGFYYLPICAAFTTEEFMRDSARWISVLMRLGNVLLAIAERCRRASFLRSLISIARKSPSELTEESIVPPAETQICFSSNGIEVHPCPQCRYPMTQISDKSSNSFSGLRSFHCFNCDDAGRSRFLCQGSVSG